MWSVGSTTGQGQTLVEGTQTATLTHNGVNWKYSNKGAESSAGQAASVGVHQAQAAQTNAITITGSGIKIYKAMNGNNGYQTYIKGAPTARAEAEGITVKITLVPNTLTASSVKK